MIAVRKSLTVPAAGSYALVEIAGSGVYVEESPDDTPEGAPTWHLAQDETGVPMFSRSAFSWEPGFKRFFIRGTALSAGSTLYYLVFDDPCAGGVLDANAPFDFSDCPDAAEPIAEPTGTPTHALVATTSLIRVYTTGGTLVRTVWTGTNFITGKVFVNYFAEWIYFVTENAGGNISLRRINFDGTGEVEIVDVGVAAGAGISSVTFDSSIGKFVIASHDRIIRVFPDGTGLQVQLQPGGIVGFLECHGKENGLDYYIFDNNDILIQDYATHTAAANTAGTFTRGEYDPVTNKVFAGNNSAEIRSFDGDLGTSVEIDTTTTDNGSFYIYGRWLYYRNTLTSVKRVHLDDYATIEDIAAGLPSGGQVAPWWE